jgi:hypothetical protein
LQGAIKNGQTRTTCNIERKPKGQSKMDKPEQLATVCPFLIALLFSLYVASCPGLSIFDCPFGFLSILPIALVCSFLIAPLVFSLGNIVRKPMGQSKMNKQEQLAT